MILPMIGNWFSDIMALLFVGLFDTVAYWLLSVSYTVFDAIAHVDLFGASEAGREIYDLITKRLYTTISIVMVFVFAYQMIMLIVDPEGKEKGASTKLVKETLISIITVILLPTVFKYMAYFQIHVVDNGTIPAIILGNSGFSSDDPGRTIAMMTYMSFFHPNGTGWNDYFDEKGKMRVDADTVKDAAKDIRNGNIISGYGNLAKAVDESEAYANCKSKVIYGDVENGFLFIKWESDGEDNAHEICEDYVASLLLWKLGLGAGVSSITTNSDLREAISEDNGSVMAYQWILATVAGLLVAWTFFSYSLDIGTRAVKLGVLQLISPVPVICRIFNKKMFDSWFKEIKKCYLELFIRLAIIFFGIVIIQMVPQFLDMVFTAVADEDGLFAKCIATFLLILGILKFCQDAPGLFKEIFSAGGNLLEGMNLKPGVRSRIEDNKLAMKGYGAATGAISGGLNRGISAAKKSWADTKGDGQAGGTKIGRFARAVGAGFKGAPRGIIAGGKSGIQHTPQKLNAQDFKATTQAGATAAKNSYNNRSELLKNLEAAKREYVVAKSDHSADPTSVQKREEAFKKLWGNRASALAASHRDDLQRRKDGVKEAWKNAGSDSVSYQERQQSSNRVTQGVSNLNSMANTAAAEQKKKDLQAKINVETNPDVKALLEEQLRLTKEDITKRRAEAASDQAHKSVSQKIMGQMAKDMQAAQGNWTPEFISKLDKAAAGTINATSGKFESASTANAGEALRLIENLSSGRAEFTPQNIERLNEIKSSIEGYERTMKAGQASADLGQTPISGGTKKDDKK